MPACFGNLSISQLPDGALWQPCQSPSEGFYLPLPYTQPHQQLSHKSICVMGHDSRTEGCKELIFPTKKAWSDATLCYIRL